jgi:hypothetical protein
MRLSKTYYSGDGDSLLKICYRCHVPQYTDDLHPFNTTAGEGRMSCTYYDIILPACFVVFQDAGLRALAQIHFKQSWGTLEKFSSWIVDQDHVVEDHWSNGEAMFLWYASQKMGKMT